MPRSYDFQTMEPDRRALAQALLILRAANPPVIVPGTPGVAPAITGEKCFRDDTVTIRYDMRQSDDVEGAGHLLVILVPPETSAPGSSEGIDPATVRLLALVDEPQNRCKFFQFWPGPWQERIAMLAEVACATLDALQHGA